MLRSIKTRWLTSQGACVEQIATFAAEWPAGAAVTRANIARATALHLDLNWLATRLLRGPARAEYNRVRDLALAEYERVRGQAWAEYERVRGQARAEYERVRGPARAEYNRVCGQALCAALGL